LLEFAVTAVEEVRGEGLKRLDVAVTGAAAVGAGAVVVDAVEKFGARAQNDLLLMLRGLLLLLLARKF